MRVLIAGVVVDVDGANALAHRPNSRQNSLGQVGMANIEADADIVKVADGEDLHQVLRLCHFILFQIFEQNLHSQRTRESAQMLDCG